MDYWITRDGRELTPDCMTCEHLHYSIMRILRMRWRMEWLSRLLDEYNRRCLPKVTKSQTSQLERV